MPRKPNFMIVITDQQSGHPYFVRISDHGDMAMSHGLQRQKMFNMYEETLNVPFVISNHNLFKHCRGEQTDSLVSLIDLLPTLANLAGVPDLDRWVFKGKDLSPILSNPKAEVQSHVHFTYEDLYFFVSASSHIRAIVDARHDAARHRLAGALGRAAARIGLAFPRRMTDG